MKQRKAFSYGGVFEKLMSAITFAEEGEHEKALPDLWKGLKCPLVIVSKGEAPPIK